MRLALLLALGAWIAPVCSHACAQSGDELEDLAVERVSAVAEERAEDLASPVLPASAGFALDVSAAALLPLSLGVRIALEVPGHVLFHVSAGVVPSSFVDAVGNVGAGGGAWSQHDAQVASTLLSNATWLEVGLGIRPFGTPGIELDLGYAILWSHRIVTANGVGMTAQVDDAIGMDLVIDAIHAEVAVQTELTDHVFFRLALGWAHAIAHGVSLVSASTDASARAAMEQAESALAAEVGRRAFGPTVGASLGARF